eukprot:sb/3467351/
MIFLPQGPDEDSPSFSPSHVFRTLWRLPDQKSRVLMSRRAPSAQVERATETGGERKRRRERKKDGRKRRREKERWERERGRKKERERERKRERERERERKREKEGDDGFVYIVNIQEAPAKRRERGRERERERERERDRERERESTGNTGEYYVSSGHLSWARWLEGTDRRDTSKQPIRTRYLDHVTGYQPIRDQYFLPLTQYIHSGYALGVYVVAREPAGRIEFIILKTRPQGFNLYVSLFLETGINSEKHNLSLMAAQIMLNCSKEPTDTNKQPIRTRYLGHKTSYQPIMDQYLPNV